MARPVSNVKKWAAVPTPKCPDPYRVRPGMWIIVLNRGHEGRVLQVDDRYCIYRAEGRDMEAEWGYDDIAVKTCDADVPRDITDDAFHCNADPFYLAGNELRRCAMRIDRQLAPYDVDDPAASELERGLAQAEMALSDLSEAARALWMWGDLERQRAEHEAANARRAPEAEAGEAPAGTAYAGRVKAAEPDASAEPSAGGGDPFYVMSNEVRRFRERIAGQIDGYARRYGEVEFKAQAVEHHFADMLCDLDDLSHTYRNDWMNGDLRPAKADAGTPA